MITKIARVCFWISPIIGVIGLFICFYPGAEFQWFALAAALAIPGLIIPKWSFRSVALVMLVLWSAIAWTGYTRGKEYQEWHKENPLEERIQELEEQIRLMEPNNAEEAETPQQP